VTTVGSDDGEVVFESSDAWEIPRNDLCVDGADHPPGTACTYRIYVPLADLQPGSYVLSVEVGWPSDERLRASRRTRFTVAPEAR
jgi:hypothetical protein